MIVPPIKNTVSGQSSEPSQPILDSGPSSPSIIPQPLIPDLLDRPLSMSCTPIFLQAREVLAKPTQLAMKAIESFGQPVSSFPTEEAKSSALKVAVYAVTAFIMPDSGE